MSQNRVLIIIAIMVAAVLATIAVVWSQQARQTPAEASSQTQTPIEVVWRGYVAAVVIDYANGTSITEYYFVFSNGTRVPLDLSNATISLKEPLANYIGKPEKLVHVRGIYNGKTLKALEVYD